MSAPIEPTVSSPSQAAERPGVPPELARAWLFHEAGDFRQAAASARAVLASDPPPPKALANAAHDVLNHLAPDPWALRIGIATLAFLVIVSAHYLGW